MFYIQACSPRLPEDIWIWCDNEKEMNRDLKRMLKQDAKDTKEGKMFYTNIYYGQTGGHPRKTAK